MPAVDFDLPETGFNLEDYVSEIEKRLILKALDRTRGSKKAAADMLGLSFRSFRYRCEKYQID